MDITPGREEAADIGDEQPFLDWNERHQTRRKDQQLPETRLRVARRDHQGDMR